MKLMSILSIFLIVCISFAAVAEEKTEAEKKITVEKKDTAKEKEAVEKETKEKPKVEHKMLGISVKDMEPAILFMKKVKGSYDKHESVIPEVYSQLARLGIQPAGPVMGIYYDNPQQVAEEKLHWAIALPVKEKTEQSLPTGYVFEEKEAYKAATATIKGPYGDLSKFYVDLYDWIAEQGYMPAGPPMESWLGDPTSTPPSELKTELIVPITKPNM